MIIEKGEGETMASDHLEVDPKDAEKISDGIPQYAIDILAEFFLERMREEWEKQNQEKVESGSEL